MGGGALPSWCAFVQVLLGGVGTLAALPRLTLCSCRCRAFTKTLSTGIRSGGLRGVALFSLVLQALDDNVQCALDRFSSVVWRYVLALVAMRDNPGLVQGVLVSHLACGVRNCLLGGDSSSIAQDGTRCTSKPTS